MGPKNNYLHCTLFDIHKAPQGYSVLASHKTIRLGVPLLAVIYGFVGKKVGQISQTARTSQSWELKGVPGRLWGQQRVCWMASAC